MKKKYSSERNSGTISVKEGIEALLRSYKLRGKYNATKAVEMWPKIMGAPIANRTEKIYIKDQVLFVRLNSAPLKQELTLSKEKIIRLYEEQIGSGVIKDIIFR